MCHLSHVTVTTNVKKAVVFVRDYFGLTLNRKLSVCESCDSAYGWPYMSKYNVGRRV